MYSTLDFFIELGSDYREDLDGLDCGGDLELRL